MVIHADVNEPDSDALTLLDDHRGAIGTSLAVEGEPVELHRKCVRHSVVWQQRPLLNHDPEVAIEWPADLELIPSARDAAAPLLRDIADELPFVYESSADLASAPAP